MNERHTKTDAGKLMIAAELPAVEPILKERYEKYQNVIQEFVLMDDTFMRVVLKDFACTEYLLQTILQQPELKVKDVVVQKDYKNLHGRSLILDCVAVDQYENRYDFEFQQEVSGLSPKRARYHSSLMDMHMLEAGQRFEELKDSTIIFLVNGAACGSEDPISHVKKVFAENLKEFQDGSEIILVNAKADLKMDTELGRLLHDLKCKHADEMYSPVLAKQVRKLKETEGGIQVMCKAMDQLCQEAMNLGESRGIVIGEKRGKKEGKKIGAMKAKKETAISLYEMGLEMEQIAQAVKMDSGTVQGWLKGKWA